MSTICLAYMKPSVGSPALYKLDVIVRVCNLSTQKVEAVGSRVQGSRSFFSYTVNFRIAWGPETLHKWAKLNKHRSLLLLSWRHPYGHFENTKIEIKYSHSISASPHPTSVLGAVTPRGYHMWLLLQAGHSEPSDSQLSSHPLPGGTLPG